VDVSVVIPAYNEEQRLPATLRGWQRFLNAQRYASEVLVVDDGSRDGTARVAEDSGVRVVRLERNQGKGGAVRTGMLAASGEVIGYADADMNVEPAYLDDVLARLADGADVVIGSRSLSQYGSAESVSRLVAGALVQVTRRTLVLPTLRDTQCGFKFFRRQMARDVFSRTRINSFAFDIEALYLARRQGARIAELPVRTSYRTGSTFDVSKHLPEFLRDIGRVRVNALEGRYR
jgi:glycosyltransferase involved in cell wall biosynthesis